mgnify:CR=1 FL=1
MLQVVNHTPFAASLSVFPDPSGVETAYAVVKATFSIGAEGPVPAQPQVPLLAADVFWGDPVTTSLRAAGDFALLKPGTDVLLVGRAVGAEQAAMTRLASLLFAGGIAILALGLAGGRRRHAVGVGAGEAL